VNVAKVSYTRARSTRIRRGELVVCLVWLAAVVFGSVWLWRYKSTPGAAGPAPRSWPTEASIARTTGMPTLVMFAHPWCPCTRASIGELAVVMSKAAGHVDAHVLFDRPSSEADDWTATDLWRSASAIPGVTVHIDRDGEEAARFGAETSGHVVLYDAEGRLRFSGGITNARGHAGDSEGRRAVLALVLHGDSNRSQAPVFGCSLDSPELAEKQ
jgi:hypothetical protein